MPSFVARCEALFSPRHGRRWKTACADALGIGRASLYRYLDGTSEVPDAVLRTLAEVETPSNVPVWDDRNMARLMALAVIKLRQALDAENWLKPPYPPEVQRFLDLCAARNVMEGGDAWPADVGALVKRAGQRLSAWMQDTDAWDEDGVFTEEPLLDGEQPTPTCRELAGDIEGRSPEDELVEARGFTDFRLACATHRDGVASYATWRRFVVERPVVTRFIDELVRSPALASVPDVQEAFGSFYEAVPAALAEKGRVPTCRVSGTILRRDGRAFLTESHVPEAVRLARDGTCDFVTWTPSLRTLRRPFRTFWCLPGKAEVRLMDDLAAAGWVVQAWPDLDAVDVAATSPDGTRKVAIDVKDYASPALLAARFEGFKGYERTHECFLAVADARLAADRTYAATFANLRSSFGKKPVTLRSVSRLVRELGSKP